VLKTASTAGTRHLMWSVKCCVVVGPRSLDAGAGFWRVVRIYPDPYTPRYGRVLIGSGASVLVTAWNMPSQCSCSVIVCWTPWLESCLNVGF
jgi:hypothetical protein